MYQFVLNHIICEFRNILECSLFVKQIGIPQNNNIKWIKMCVFKVSVFVIKFNLWDAFFVTS